MSENIDFHIAYESETAQELARDTEWWEIYHDSFPAGERESREVILLGVHHGVSLAIRAKSGDKTVGLANIHLLQEPASVFLSYIAVIPSMREHHIGAALFEHAWQIGRDALLRKTKSPIGYVWEVEDPALAANAEQKTQRDKRLHFYKKLGGVILTERYMLPPFSETAVATPMLLMFRPETGMPLPAGKEITALIDTIYYEKYAAVNGVATQLLDTLERWEAV